VAEIAALSVQRERIRLWKALNALRPVRPMIFLNPQNGWPDLAPESDLQCEDQSLRGIERSLRMTIRRHELIHDDCPITADWPVGWAIRTSGIGAAETYTYTQARGVFHWDPPIKEYADFKKLHPATWEVDRKAGDESLAFHQALLGDILNVRRGGVNFCRCGLTRKLIMLRGLDTWMLDLYDAPQFVHELSAFLRDELIREFEFYERENLLALNNGPDDGCGSGGMAANDDLPGPDYNPARVRMKNMFIWAESQESVGVGPDQFNEFVLQYQLPLARRFGLVDYGCCESLDNKLDLILAAFPRLRWVAVAPWADREIAAARLTNRYVYCYKPQPSSICRPKADWAAAEQELRDTLRIAQGCCVSLVLKDTVSFFGQPERTTQWTDMAQRVVAETA
jgi:hypothetical protein